MGRNLEVKVEKKAAVSSATYIFMFKYKANKLKYQLNKLQILKEKKKNEQKAEKGGKSSCFFCVRALSGV